MEPILLKNLLIGSGGFFGFLIEKKLSSYLKLPDSRYPKFLISLSDLNLTESTSSKESKKVSK